MDTSLKVLLQAGITPHAVITLDAQPHTLFAFQGMKLKNILLFSDLAANPAILRNVEARAVIFSATAQVNRDFQGKNTPRIYDRKQNLLKPYMVPLDIYNQEDLLRLLVWTYCVP